MVSKNKVAATGGIGKKKREETKVVSVEPLIEEPGYLESVYSKVGNLFSGDWFDQETLESFFSSFPKKLNYYTYDEKKEVIKYIFSKQFFSHFQREQSIPNLIDYLSDRETKPSKNFVQELELSAHKTGFEMLKNSNQDRKNMVDLLLAVEKYLPEVIDSHKIESLADFMGLYANTFKSADRLLSQSLRPKGVLGKSASKLIANITEAQSNLFVSSLGNWLYGPEQNIAPEIDYDVQTRINMGFWGTKKTDSYLGPKTNRTAPAIGPRNLQKLDAIKAIAYAGLGIHAEIDRALHPEASRLTTSTVDEVWNSARVSLLPLYKSDSSAEEKEAALLSLRFVKKNMKKYLMANDEVASYLAIVFANNVIADVNQLKKVTENHIENQQLIEAIATIGFFTPKEMEMISDGGLKVADGIKAYEFIPGVYGKPLSKQEPHPLASKIDDFWKYFRLQFYDSKNASAILPMKNANMSEILSVTKHGKISKALANFPSFSSAEFTKDKDPFRIKEIFLDAASSALYEVAQVEDTRQVIEDPERLIKDRESLDIFLFAVEAVNDNLASGFTGSRAMEKIDLIIDSWKHLSSRTIASYVEDMLGTKNATEVLFDKNALANATTDLQNKVENIVNGLVQFIEYEKKEKPRRENNAPKPYISDVPLPFESGSDEDIVGQGSQIRGSVQKEKQKESGPSDVPAPAKSRYRADLIPIFNSNGIYTDKQFERLASEYTAINDFLGENFPEDNGSFDETLALYWAIQATKSGKSFDRNRESAGIKPHDVLTTHLSTLTSFFSGSGADGPQVGDIHLMANPSTLGFRIAPTDLLATYRKEYVSIIQLLAKRYQEKFQTAYTTPAYALSSTFMLNDAKQAILEDKSEKGKQLASILMAKSPEIYNSLIGSAVLHSAVYIGYMLEPIQYSRYATVLSGFRNVLQATEKLKELSSVNDPLALVDSLSEMSKQIFMVGKKASPVKIMNELEQLSNSALGFAMLDAPWTTEQDHQKIDEIFDKMSATMSSTIKGIGPLFHNVLGDSVGLEDSFEMINALGYAAARIKLAIDTSTNGFDAIAASNPEAIPQYKDKLNALVANLEQIWVSAITEFTSETGNKYELLAKLDTLKDALEFNRLINAADAAGNGVPRERFERDDTAFVGAVTRSTSGNHLAPGEEHQWRNQVDSDIILSPGQHKILMSEVLNPVQVDAGHSKGKFRGRKTKTHIAIQQTFNIYKNIKVTDTASWHTGRSTSFLATFTNGLATILDTVKRFTDTNDDFLSYVASNRERILNDAAVSVLKNQQFYLDLSEEYHQKAIKVLTSVINSAGDVQIMEMDIEEYFTRFDSGIASGEFSSASKRNVQSFMLLSASKMESDLTENIFDESSKSLMPEHVTTYVDETISRLQTVKETLQSYIENNFYPGAKQEIFDLSARADSLVAEAIKAKQTKDPEIIAKFSAWFPSEYSNCISDFTLFSENNFINAGEAIKRRVAEEHPVTPAISNYAARKAKNKKREKSDDLEESARLHAGSISSELAMTSMSPENIRDNVSRFMQTMVSNYAEILSKVYDGTSDVDKALKQSILKSFDMVGSFASIPKEELITENTGKSYIFNSASKMIGAISKNLGGIHVDKSNVQDFVSFLSAIIDRLSTEKSLVDSFNEEDISRQLEAVSHANLNAISSSRVLSGLALEFSEVFENFISKQHNSSLRKSMMENLKALEKQKSDSLLKLKESSETIRKIQSDPNLKMSEESLAKVRAEISAAKDVLMRERAKVKARVGVTISRLMGPESKYVKDYITHNTNDADINQFLESSRGGRPHFSGGITQEELDGFTRMHGFAISNKFKKEVDEYIDGHYKDAMEVYESQEKDLASTEKFVTDQRSRLKDEQSIFSSYNSAYSDILKTMSQQSSSDRARESGRTRTMGQINNDILTNKMVQDGAEIKDDTISGRVGLSSGNFNEEEHKDLVRKAKTRIAYDGMLNSIKSENMDGTLFERLNDFTSRLTASISDRDEYRKSFRDLLTLGTNSLQLGEEEKGWMRKAIVTIDQLEANAAKNDPNLKQELTKLREPDAKTQPATTTTAQPPK